MNPFKRAIKILKPSDTNPVTAMDFYFTPAKSSKLISDANLDDTDKFNIDLMRTEIGYEKNIVRQDVLRNNLYGNEERTDSSKKVLDKRLEMTDGFVNSIVTMFLYYIHKLMWLNENKDGYVYRSGISFNAAYNALKPFIEVSNKIHDNMIELLYPDKTVSKLVEIDINQENREALKALGDIDKAAKESDVTATRKSRKRAAKPKKIVVKEKKIKQSGKGRKKVEKLYEKEVMQ